jgi:hypothetical protein
MPERSQAGIVSRIARKVASEANRRQAPHPGVEFRQNMPKTGTFRRQIPKFRDAALVATQ